MPNRRNDGMAWLTAVTNEEDAAVLSELLARADIPFYAVRRGAGGYLRIVMGTSMFGQDIYVREEDYDEALALLEDCYAMRDVSDAELDWQAAHAEPMDEAPEESGSYRTFFWILGALVLLLAVLGVLRVLL